MSDCCDESSKIFEKKLSFLVAYGVFLYALKAVFIRLDIKKIKRKGI